MCCFSDSAIENVFSFAFRVGEYLVHTMLMYAKMFCQNRKSYVKIDYGINLNICLYESTYNIATLLQIKLIKILKLKKIFC